MIWVPIIIPILFAIFALIFFRKQIAFWEPFIPVAATLLIIVFFKFIGVSSLTKDKEFWGNYVTEVRHYEHWDEWIEQTCSEQYACGTDSKGNTTYCTRYYDCSYRKDHPEYWTMILNDGTEHDIEYSYYNYLKNKFNTKSTFIDMNRDFYHIDGDMYSNLYPNTYDAYEFIASEHSYENKVQASTSIFNYPEIDTSDIKRYKLYDYPEVKNSQLNAILAPNTIKITADEQKKYDYINGIFGQDKKVRTWVLLFESPFDIAGFKQEALWKRGNKNELIVCIGVDKSRNITWVHVFGWAKEKLIEIETRDFVKEQKVLNLSALGDFLFTEVQTKWKKTSFKDFEYLAIEPPTWAYVTIWIVSFVVCIALYFWIIVNQFTSTDYNGDGYDEYNENDDSKIQYILNRINKFFFNIKDFFVNILGKIRK